jgi:hypothetical protein
MYPRRYAQIFFMITAARPPYPVFQSFQDVESSDFAVNCNFIRENIAQYQPLPDNNHFTQTGADAYLFFSVFHNAAMIFYMQLHISQEGNTGQIHEQIFGKFKVLGTEDDNPVRVVLTVETKEDIGVIRGFTP